MKKISSFFFILTTCIFSGVTTFAWEPIDILVAGDSWASLLCLNHGFERIFHDYKFNKDEKSERVRSVGCTQTTKFGSRTSFWLKDENFAEIADYLGTPTVKFVYLSLGGNDALYSWSMDMSEEKQLKLAVKIYKNIETLIAKIFELRPDVKIILSGYDFPNFESYTRGFSGYDNVYKHMGFPSPEIVNKTLLKLSRFLSPLSKIKNVYYIHHYGLMHYYYGNSDYNLEPKQTAPPEMISPPDDPNAYGGRIELPNDPDALMNFGYIFYDPFHLGRRGFYYVAKHVMDHYLAAWIKEEIIKQSEDEKPKENSFSNFDF